MKIKRFVAASMQEAVMKVKSELGTNAVILHTRRFREKGLLGLVGAAKVEVLAGVEKERKEIPRLEKELEDLRALIFRLNNQVAAPKQNGTLPAPIKRFINVLHTAGVEKRITDELLGGITFNEEVTPWEVEQFLAKIRGEVLAGLPPVVPLKPGNKNPRVIAFVGPSGSGKTTVLSKLAANFTMAHRQDVGLITLDNFRMGAVEQLKNYSEILDLELEVVLNQNQLDKAIGHFQTKNIIFIDTPGRNPFCNGEGAELLSMLKTDFINDILLVLSLTTREKELLRLRDRYREVGFKGYIFTKLDETNDWGTVLNLVWGESEYLSYITHGQNVPADIELIEPKRFLCAIMGEEK